MASHPTDPSRVHPALVLGDALTYFLVSFYGFAAHGLIGRASLDRFLATFLPFTAAYLLLVWALGGLDHRRARSPRELWRPAAAALAAAPLGAGGRGLWLGAVPAPVFVGVMAGVSLGFVLAWRLIFLRFPRRPPAR